MSVAPIVSVLVRHADAPSRVLLQVRSKPWAGRYRGTYELPQGHLDEGESILECARRELLEETGLSDFQADARVLQSLVMGEELGSVTSLIVTESGDQAYLAVCIVGVARGIPRPSAESEAPAWYERLAVARLIAEERVFPLNVPMLRWHFGLD